MRIRILASAPEQSAAKQYLTTFLINDVVAIDAGCIGLHGEPDDQSRIGHVFLTHTHADHIASLPVFVENAYRAGEDCVIVHGSPTALECIRTDIFNDRIWPDLLDRLAPPERPFLKLAALESEKPVEVAGLRITPVAVEHQIEAFGFIVEDESSSVVFGGDSAPTQRIWKLASGLEQLAAVFLEASFPDELAELAEVSAHLTPRLVRGEIAKIPARAEVIAIHIKPRYRQAVVEQLAALGIERLSIGECGREYSF